MENLDGYYDFEISGGKKIQEILKSRRDVEISFKDACNIWTAYSDEKYCAGWMAFEVFGDDLEKSVLEAYDNHAVKEICPAKKTLKDKLKDWTDVDVACYYLAICLGLMNETTSFPVEAKHVFWTNNAVGNMLIDMVDSMIAEQILKAKDDGQLVRWNSKFKGSWEK